jgi:hypothetical protein
LTPGSIWYHSSSSESTTQLSSTPLKLNCGASAEVISILNIKSRAYPPESLFGKLIVTGIFESDILIVVIVLFSILQINEFLPDNLASINLYDLLFAEYVVSITSITSYLILIKYECPASNW